MTQKTYIVEGRQFRTEVDYRRAIHDKEIIDKLRAEIRGSDRKALVQLKSEVHDGKYNFMTLLEQDFEDELEDMIRKSQETAGAGNSAGSRKNAVPSKRKGTGRQKESGRLSGTGKVRDGGEKAGASALHNGERKGRTVTEDPALEAIVREELKKQEKRRKLLITCCCILAAGCLGYFGIYSYFDYRTNARNSRLNELKNNPVQQTGNSRPVIHYTTEESSEPREVLEEFKNLLNKNKKLIGWVTIDDTNINYPVMQTSDNEYYLDHNMNQEYDKNGSIFMDKDCDVLNPSTNLILYGHHMKSGQMFGSLDRYSEKTYYEEHPYIQFDTIYEKGTYQVMYVFRSRVYSEEEIVFKYYQFIDAVSEQEFNSNMQEMAQMSLYDTGVTAQYGDHLLTLSTCDYKEKNGRFVVVAKKVAAKE